MLIALLESIASAVSELFFGWLERRSPWLFWSVTLSVLAALVAIVVYVNR